MEHKLIAAAEPQQESRSGGGPVCHLCYRIGTGGRLFRARTAVQPRGGLMGLDAAGWDGAGRVQSLCQEVARECGVRHFSGVVCRFDGFRLPPLAGLVRQLEAVCRDRGLELYVREGDGAEAPSARVLIPSALSGGSLRRRLEAAGQRFGQDRLALWLDRSAEDFLLPSPTGAGTPLTPEELDRLRTERGASVYFSDELCAHYFTYMIGGQGHFVLFDDGGSLRRKRALAEELGVGVLFLPLAEWGELAPELLAER